jgi:hypothetical protein
MIPWQLPVSGPVPIRPKMIGNYKLLLPDDEILLNKLRSHPGSAADHIPMIFKSFIHIYFSLNEISE